MVPNATKLESKFPRETAAVAGRSAFGGTPREFHENTPGLLNDLLQLLRFQCLGWRVVNSAADSGRVNQSDNHARYLFYMNQR